MHKAKLKQTDVNKCTIKKPNCFHPRKCLDPKVRTFFSEEGPPAFNPLVASTSPLYHAAFPRHRIIVILSQKALKVSHVGVFSTKVTSQHSRATTCGHYGFHVVATDYSWITTGFVHVTWREYPSMQPLMQNPNRFNLS